MPKYNLLELVQKTATSIGSDEVNSINDTQDALDIASLAEDTYYELINHRDWDHLNGLVAPTSTSDSTRPNYLKLPDDVRELKAVEYNVRSLTDTKDRYKEMVWKSPTDFLTAANALNSSLTNVTVTTDFGGLTYNVRNDVAPQYYTTFDDDWLAFDSYDSGVDSTLQVSKGRLLVIREPIWTMSDTFIPDLPIDGFPLLLAELKSIASVVVRQEHNQKEEQKAQRQARRMSGKNFRVNDLQEVPNYGRS